MRYLAIQEHGRRYPIRLMCRALAVSAAGYYAWCARPESSWSFQARTLRVAIRVVHQEVREIYGSPLIWKALATQGHRVSEASCRQADASGRHSSQDCEEVARHYPVESSIARGREHPGSCRHR